jgi:hypothetical protein
MKHFVFTLEGKFETAGTFDSFNVYKPPVGTYRYVPSHFYPWEVMTASSDIYRFWDIVSPTLVPAAFKAQILLLGYPL